MLSKNLLSMLCAFALGFTIVGCDDDDSSDGSTTGTVTAGTGAGEQGTAAEEGTEGEAGGLSQDGGIDPTKGAETGETGDGETGDDETGTTG